MSFEWSTGRGCRVPFGTKVLRRRIRARPGPDHRDTGRRGGTNRCRRRPTARQMGHSAPPCLPSPCSVVAQRREIPRPGRRRTDLSTKDVMTSATDPTQSVRQPTRHLPRGRCAGDQPGLAHPVAATTGARAWRRPVPMRASRGGRHGVPPSRDWWMRPPPSRAASTVSGWIPNRTGGGVVTPRPRQPASHRRAAVPPHLPFTRTSAAIERCRLAATRTPSAPDGVDVVTPTAGFQPGQSGLDHP